MSTDSHSAMAAELARYRKALRAIADLESLPIGDQSEEMGSRLMAARLASAALTGGEESAEPDETTAIIAGRKAALETFHNHAAHGLDAGAWARETLALIEQHPYRRGFIAGLEAALCMEGSAP